MKKQTFVSIVIILALIMSFFSSCSNANFNKERETQETEIETLNINNKDNKKILELYCSLIPPFSSVDTVDDNFWHILIYNVYTKLDILQGNVIKGEDGKSWVAVSQEDMNAMAQLLLGCDIDYIPQEEDLCYGGGFFYILQRNTVSENISYTYKNKYYNRYSFRNNKDCAVDTVDIKCVDNKNGFVILRHFSTSTQWEKEEKNIKEGVTEEISSVVSEPSVLSHKMETTDFASALDEILVFGGEKDTDTLRNMAVAIDIENWLEECEWSDDAVYVFEKFWHALSDEEQASFASKFLEVSQCMNIIVTNDYDDRAVFYIRGSGSVLEHDYYTKKNKELFCTVIESGMMDL